MESARRILHVSGSHGPGVVLQEQSLGLPGGDGSVCTDRDFLVLAQCPSGGDLRHRRAEYFSDRYLFHDRRLLREMAT
ncbi:hypothetical protein D3C84_1168540 [compost metagenome]